LQYSKTRIKMATKLTITVNKTIIEEAKSYAKSQGRSLSNLIEEYLKSVVNKKKHEDDFEISPIVKSLWGSVKPISDSVNYKDVLRDEIVKKHSK